MGVVFFAMGNGFNSLVNVLGFVVWGMDSVYFYRLYNAGLLSTGDGGDVARLFFYFIFSSSCFSKFQPCTPFFFFAHLASKGQGLVYKGFITRCIHVEDRSVDLILLLSTPGNLTLVRVSAHALLPYP